jgi:hypothetical protein
MHDKDHDGMGYDVQSIHNLTYTCHYIVIKY